MVFKGVATAFVTPFLKNKQIDYKSVERLIQYQVQSKVDGILLLGSTGEGMSITEEEKRVLLPFVKGLLPKEIPLIVGVDGNNPANIVKEIEAASVLGGDACLVHPPYYVKSTQEGIFRYYEYISSRAKLPIIVYNIPSRTGVNIKPETLLRISKLDGVEGLKEANGDINHILEVFSVLGDDFPIYCGNDNLNHLFFALGGKGTISVTSNIFPEAIENMFKNAENSLKIHKKLHNFNNLMFCEPNPIPIKYVLSKFGMIENVLREPLTILEKSHKKEIDLEIMKLEELV